MAQALDTVADYIAHARILLQDTVVDYRYSDSELIDDLNLGLLEMRRLRPDLMITTFGGTIPKYTATNQTVACDPQYRSALLYYICGQAQLRDDEATQDSRATIFLNKFVAQLQTIGA